MNKKIETLEKMTTFISVVTLILTIITCVIDIKDFLRKLSKE